MDEARTETAKKIFDEFVDRAAPRAVDILTDEMVASCKERICEYDRDLFLNCMRIVKNYLANTPFEEFTKTMYFHRYLQWKWLER